VPSRDAVGTPGERTPTADLLDGDRCEPPSNTSRPVDSGEVTRRDVGKFGFPATAAISSDRCKRGRQPRPATCSAAVGPAGGIGQPNLGDQARHGGEGGREFVAHPNRNHVRRQKDIDRPGVRSCLCSGRGVRPADRACRGCRSSSPGSSAPEPSNNLRMPPSSRSALK
jgi:hypothetical protein